MKGEKMKKVLFITALMSAVVFSEGNVVEFRAGIGGKGEVKFNKDVKFDKDLKYNNWDSKKDSEISYELGVEYRREVLRNFEVGGGLIYQNHGKIKTDNSGKNELYDSIPLYVTGRYNFRNATEFTPYVKVNVGYSFNINDGALKTKNNSISEEFNVNAKNGFYYGVGGGLEYKKFIVDLSYQTNYSDIESKNSKFNSSKANFQRVTLGFGYSLNF